MRLILASGSPRRKEILAEIAPISRWFPPRGRSGRTYPCRLPKSSARWREPRRKKYLQSFPIAPYSARIRSSGFAAARSGKPKDEGEAAATLRALSANEHEVYTGVCILAGEREECFFSRSVVRFRALDEEFIRAYVSTGSPMDKAGSYGIQDHPAPVCSYTGSFSNIVGLPKEEVREKLVSMGILQ